jgi:lipoprotein NlpD
MRRALAALLASAVLLTACGGEPERRPAPATYVVKRGDTLYSIASRHGLDYREVARWNRIGSDYRIDVGQVLVLSPRTRPRAGTASRPAAAGSTAPGRVADAPASPDPASVAPPPRPAFDWVWPADGTVAGAVRQPAGGVGLRIDGRIGQEVRAAGPGRVVYTGAGLRAYGQLVIVKHDDVYLSAYGHNSEVYVREGDEVRAGQRIAAMGPGPGNRPMLYFEIRVNGRPLDPLRFLPRR